MAQPPGYRPAENPRESCKTCAYFARGNWCEMFSVAVKAEKTCDKWTATRSEVPMPETRFYWEGWEGRREYSDALRKKYAKEGIALPDGSFPIPDVSALKDAISAYGRAGDKGAAKAHIKKRARALGRTDLIPESWRSEPAMPNTKGRFDDRAFTPGEPDQDDLGGPDDGDGVESCTTCDGTGELDMGQCPDCQGTGFPKGEGLMAGQQSFNSAGGLLEARIGMLSGMVESRQFPAQMEIRKASNGKDLLFEGLPSVTERGYQVGDFEETMVTGAFQDARNEDVFFRIEHVNLPIARTKSGTMDLREAVSGLKVDARLDPEDLDVRSLVPKMRRGDVTDMSVAFRAVKESWNESRDKRLIHRASLEKGDVSVVTVGANPAATGEMKLRAFIDDMELRSGKRNSFADRQELKEAIRKLEALMAPEDEAAAAEAQAGLEGALKISVMRSELDLARAKRARRRVHA